MTLPLIDSWEIQPVGGASYPVNAACGHPECDKPSAHGHHLVRRSQIIGDVWWIRLPDGLVIGNVLGLCSFHHNQVSGREGGHRAAIRWIDNRLVWCLLEKANGRVVGYMPIGPCNPTTPFADDATILGLDDKGPEECPTCGRSKHAPKKGPKREARKRKTWTVQVPDDDEDGAQVLDDIVSGIVAAFDLDLDGGALTRYHALSRGGAFIIINADKIPKEAKAQHEPSPASR